MALRGSEKARTAALSQRKVFLPGWTGGPVVSLLRCRSGFIPCICPTTGSEDKNLPSRWVGEGRGGLGDFWDRVHPVPAGPHPGRELEPDIWLQFNSPVKCSAIFVFKRKKCPALRKSCKEAYFMQNGNLFFSIGGKRVLG